MTTIENPAAKPELSKPRGPYSSAIQAGNIIYLSGQGGLDSAGQMVAGGIAAETRQTLANIEANLQACGASLGNLVNATCFLTDIRDLDTFNSAWRDYFGEVRSPARTTVAVASLPFGLNLEISCQAALEQS